MNTAVGAHGLQADRAPVETGRSICVCGFGEFVDCLTIHFYRYFLAVNLDVVAEPFVIAVWGSLHLACPNSAAGLALAGPAGVNLSFITKGRTSVLFVMGMKIDP